MKRFVIMLMFLHAAPALAGDTVDAGAASSVTDKLDSGNSTSPAYATIYDGGSAAITTTAKSTATIRASFR